LLVSIERKSGYENIFFIQDIISSNKAWR